MFAIDCMQQRVEMYAQAKELTETKKALHIMLKRHEGMFRKSRNGETVPYVIHPLTMACHAFSLGIESDDLIAAILLHDVVEDCGVSSDELDVNENIRTVVDILSFKMLDGMTKEESKKIYFDNIRTSKTASIIKLLDRCNNISTMATGFDAKKMVSYIRETEEYVLPLLEEVNQKYGEYADAAFLIKYQMLSVMEAVKRMLSC